MNKPGKVEYQALNSSEEYAVKAFLDKWMNEGYAIKQLEFAAIGGGSYGGSTRWGIILVKENNE